MRHGYCSSQEKSSPAESNMAARLKYLMSLVGPEIFKSIVVFGEQPDLDSLARNSIFFAATNFNTTVGVIFKGPMASINLPSIELECKHSLCYLAGALVL